MKKENKEGIRPLDFHRHTPGPWVEDDGFISQKSWFDNGLTNENAVGICSVYDYHEGSDLHTNNSILIAASPNLLRILRKTYPSIVDLELKIEVLTEITNAMCYPHLSKERVDRINECELLTKKLEFIKEWENELSIHAKVLYYCPTCFAELLESEVSEIPQYDRDGSCTKTCYCNFCNKPVNLLHGKR